MCVYLYVCICVCVCSLRLPKKNWTRKCSLSVVLRHTIGAIINILSIYWQAIPPLL